jgi:hypothetical protein
MPRKKRCRKSPLRLWISAAHVATMPQAIVMLLYHQRAPRRIVTNVDGTCATPYPVTEGVTNGYTKVSREACIYVRLIVTVLVAAWCDTSFEASAAVTKAFGAEQRSLAEDKRCCCSCAPCG